jgi:hypothetical protein
LQKLDISYLGIPSAGIELILQALQGGYKCQNGNTDYQQHETIEDKVGEFSFRDMAKWSIDAKARRLVCALRKFLSTSDINDRVKPVFKKEESDHTIGALEFKEEENKVSIMCGDQTNTETYFRVAHYFFSCISQWHILFGPMSAISMNNGPMRGLDRSVVQLCFCIAESVAKRNFAEVDCLIFPVLKGPAKVFKGMKIFAESKTTLGNHFSPVLKNMILTNGLFVEVPAESLLQMARSAHGSVLSSCQNCSCPKQAHTFVRSGICLQSINLIGNSLGAGSITNILMNLEAPPYSICGASGRELDLSAADLGPECAQLVAYELMHNGALTSLDISNNSIGAYSKDGDGMAPWIATPEGPKAIAEALKDHA